MSFRPDGKKIPMLLACALLLGAAPTRARNVTIDDLMKLRTIVDARISPDGTRVAYAVSTPSLERNAHEGRSSSSRPMAATSTGAGNARLAPRCRHPGCVVSGRRARFVLAETNLASRRSTPGFRRARRGRSPPRPREPELTSGRRAAGLFYLARDPAPEEEQRRRKEGSFVMRADAPAPPTRLWRQDLDGSRRAS
jgi:hypothetical protein